MWKNIVEEFGSGIELDNSKAPEITLDFLEKGIDVPENAIADLDRPIGETMEFRELEGLAIELSENSAAGRCAKVKGEVVLHGVLQVTY